MNITRMGHYHVPTGSDNSGYCQAALVVATSDETGHVNLVVWTSTGTPEPRLGVAAVEPRAGEATFHLSQECPYGR